MNSRRSRPDPDAQCVSPLFPQKLLLSQPCGCLGDAESGTLELPLPHLHWLVLAGGETPMAQGEPGDAMYVPGRGRLRALMAGEDGLPRVVRGSRTARGSAR